MAPAGPEAAAQLAEVHGQAFDAPWNARAIRDVLASPGAFAVASWEGSRLLGFAIARRIVDEAEILTLAVVPAARRRGVGAALLEDAAGLAVAAGATTLWLEVAEDNAAAIALYAAARFEVRGRRPRYYARPTGPAVDALLMQRPLNSGAT